MDKYHISSRAPGFRDADPGTCKQLHRARILFVLACTVVLYHAQRQDTSSIDRLTITAGIGVRMNTNVYGIHEPQRTHHTSRPWNLRALVRKQQNRTRLPQVILQLAIFLSRSEVAPPRTTVTALIIPGFPSTGQNAMEFRCCRKNPRTDLPHLIARLGRPQKEQRPADRTRAGARCPPSSPSPQRVVGRTSQALYH